MNTTCIYISLVFIPLSFQSRPYPRATLVVASYSSILIGHILDLWKSNEQKRSNFLKQLWDFSKLKSHLPTTRAKTDPQTDPESAFEEIDNFCPFAVHKFRCIYNTVHCFFVYST